MPRSKSMDCRRRRVYKIYIVKKTMDAGFNVNVFEDGNEVVNQLDIDKPHVLLTDLKMPGRDGMDLLDTFKTNIQTYQSL